LINDLSVKGVKITFVRQPELSTTGSHGKLLLAIYSYFAEAEREFISVRVKQGLAAAKAKGVKLGRPKGSRNKKRVLDPHRNKILKYLQRPVWGNWGKRHPPLPGGCLLPFVMPMGVTLGDAAPSPRPNLVERLL
jgi:hypothetical protein